MKKIAMLVVTSALFAKVTLCYKQDFNQLSQIETVKLDGGECGGKFSVKDMKKQGWSIKDIQISKSANGFNYNYVFEKENYLKSNLKSQLKAIKQEEQNQKLIAKKKKMVKEGQKIYQSCQECHGKKGEIEAYGLSRKLKDLTLEEFKASIRDYELNEKDNGMAILMQPYLIIESDIEKVYEYLKEVNK